MLQTRSGYFRGIIIRANRGRSHGGHAAAMRFPVGICTVGTYLYVEINSQNSTVRTRGSGKGAHVSTKKDRGRGENYGFVPSHTVFGFSAYCVSRPVRRKKCFVPGRFAFSPRRHSQSDCIATTPTYVAFHLGRQVTSQVMSPRHTSFSIAR